MKVFNKDTLMLAALELENVYSEIDEPPEPVKDVHGSLQEQISAAKKKMIDEPAKDEFIPGFFQQKEGLLSDNPEYEKSYMKFKVELQGGYTQEELDLLEIMKSF